MAGIQIEAAAVARPQHFLGGELAVAGEVPANHMVPKLYYEFLNYV
jgi:hypothetical protein